MPNDRGTYVQQLLQAEINKLVEDDSDESVLIKILNHILSRRYYGAEFTRIEHLLTDVLEKAMKESLDDWLSQHYHKIWEVIEAKLTEETLKKMAEEVADDFIESVRSGAWMGNG